jgi:aryl-alcohol dehydrogenase-like predicted oxidoreductase
MQYKTLGNTGLLVSKICLGTMTFSDGTDFWKHVGTVDQAGADAMIKASVEVGVNFIDTADVYAFGQAETTLGQSLKNLSIARKDLVIATKFSGRVGGGRNDVGASRGHIMDAVDASLRRLQTDYIDLYQLHNTDLVTPIEETLRAMDTLISQGKIRYSGVCNMHAWRIMQALGVSEMKNLAKVDTLQAYYSIVSRELEREIVPLLENQKMGLLVFSPLAGGLLSGKFSRESQKPEGSRRSLFEFPMVDKERTWRVLDVVNPIAKSRRVSAATICLAWLLAKPVVTSVIIGAKRMEQLHENLAAAEVELTADEIKQLDEVSTLPAEYPDWIVSLGNRARLEDVPRF